MYNIFKREETLGMNSRETEQNKEKLCN